MAEVKCPVGGTHQACDRCGHVFEPLPTDGRPVPSPAFQWMITIAFRDPGSDAAVLCSNCYEAYQQHMAQWVAAGEASK